MSKLRSKLKLLNSRTHHKSSPYMSVSPIATPQRKRQCSNCNKKVNILVTYSSEVGGKAELCMECYSIAVPEYEGKRENFSAPFFMGRNLV